MTYITRISAVTVHIVILFFSLSQYCYAAWKGAPDLLLTFESGSLGSNAAKTNDSFLFAYPETTISNTHALQGNKAAQAAWNVGTIQEGGWWQPSRHLVKGDELWVRYNVFFPANFNFTHNPGLGGFKFLRVNSYNSSGAIVGHIDVYLDPGGSISINNEVDPTGLWNDFKPGTPAGIASFPLGKWASIEQYVRVGTAGNAVYRVWINDKLVGESTSLATISNGGYVFGGGIFSQINGGSRAAQKAWIDDIVVVYSPNTPPNTDSKGNRFIGSSLSNTTGSASSGTTAIPNPPSNIQ
jgi:hypothetical protein